jgi:coniferyl-aldehyde dehydrogenase
MSLALFERQRAAVQAAAVPSAKARRAHLRALEHAIKRNARELGEAIRADFGNRSLHETRLIEIFPSVEGARNARHHLAEWMTPQTRPVAPWFLPARARIVWQPLGVVGIIVPWNYPIFLAVGPLVAALAAGNRVMLKMSELTPRTGEAFARIIAATFSQDHVTVVNGDVEVAKAFAALPFDHLLFTGSTTVGKSVMHAAADHLTPVTLELGGKCPVIVGKDASLETVASRVLTIKCLNAGQTCVAPDYVLLPEGKQDAFIAAAKRVVAKRYPTMLANPDYTSIINDNHFDRLNETIQDAAEKGAHIAPLHPTFHTPDHVTRTIPPTIIAGATSAMRVMREEVFGPLLPVITYRTLDEAIAFVNARPRPLGLYYFGHHRADIDRVLERTTSGGVTLNDVAVHFLQEGLPAGGIGASGMGAYHGRDGFETFSHKKAIFEQARVSGLELLMPPYGVKFEAVFRALLR